MKPLELAMKYMEIFYNRKNIQLLKNILTSDCKFIGPCHKFDNSAEYIDSLIKDPPTNLKYKIIKSFEDNYSACLIYLFTKSDISVEMAQLFETNGEKIRSIRLIFDSKSFL